MLADHDGTSVAAGTLSAVTAALQCGGPVRARLARAAHSSSRTHAPPSSPQVSVLVAGKGCGAAATSAAGVEGVAGVFLADSPALEGGGAEALSRVMLDLQAAHSAWAAAWVGAWRGWSRMDRPPNAVAALPTPPPEFTHILGVASNYGKNVLPRVAAGLDVAPLSEVTAVRVSGGGSNALARRGSRRRRRGRLAAARDGRSLTQRVHSLPACAPL